MRKPKPPKFKDEHALFQWLISYQDNFLDMQRVENSLSPGMPDVNYAFGWLELKVLHNVKIPTDALVDIGLRPMQYMWHRRRECAKGVTYVLVGTQIGYVAVYHPCDLDLVFNPFQFWHVGVRYDVTTTHGRNLLFKDLATVYWD